MVRWAGKINVSRSGSKASSALQTQSISLEKRRQAVNLQVASHCLSIYRHAGPIIPRSYLVAGGSKTRSITWITPLSALISALITFELLMRTPPLL